MADKKNLITEAGLAKLQEELDHRISVVRNEIAKEIEFARGYGDLSENAEYTEAKNKQSENETEIMRLQAAIRNATVVSDDEISTEKVSVGTTVTVVDLESGEELTYSIVGAEEADPFEGKISNECPVGAGLVGAAIGQEVEVEAPIGILKYRIKEIKR